MHENLSYEDQIRWVHISQVIRGSWCTAAEIQQCWLVFDGGISHSALNCSALRLTDASPWKSRRLPSNRSYNISCQETFRSLLAPQREPMLPPPHLAWGLRQAPCAGHRDTKSPPPRRPGASDVVGDGWRDCKLRERKRMGERERWQLREQEQGASQLTLCKDSPHLVTVATSDKFSVKAMALTHHT